MFTWLLLPGMKTFQTYFVILRNLQASKLFPQLEKMSMKVERSGCLLSSKLRRKRIAIMYIINFWRQENKPKELYSPAFTVQKLNNIHNNPVEAGLVEKPEEYLYSSARDYVNVGNRGLLSILKI
jgi:hypothetical protein